MSYTALPRFVVRSPALPFDVLVRWSSLPDAGARRAMLRELVAEPAIREALFVASPELDAQIDAWQREPESPAGAAVERALVRYLSRMASRSTPFGLFASVAVGSLGAATALELPPLADAWRHTRLDNDLLFRLCADLAREPEVRARLRYRPSSSLYVAAGRLRYAEARGTVRTYHLTAVDRTSYLDALLARAAGGATRDELAGVLCDAEITRDEAAAFVDEVIDAQLLVPELAPSVTGREPTDAIIETLEAAGLAERAAPLCTARDHLRAIDAAPPGSPTAAYRAVHALLADGLATKVDASRLFQVDMFKPAPATMLGPEVTAELIRGAELLHALTPPPIGEDIWAQFRDRFTGRYESREVPLLEVLDEESGIGFGDKPNSPRAAPLLADLAFPTRLVAQKTQLGTRDIYLMSLVAAALRTGATEIVLTDEDVAKLSDPKPQPLPDVMSVTATLIAESSEAIARGDYQLRLAGVGRGASFLGRFCHGSPDITELTRASVRAEEAFHPEAIFAEVVHLPEGRIGNLILRPVLRDYEIAYLGTSGAPPDKQIDLADLLVSVAGERVVLRSRRLGREVIPRMTTAHNFAARGLAPYRFLCAHAEQTTARAFWGWGVMNDMPFLPRIRHRRFILDRARWILLPRDLAPVAKHGRAAIAELRTRLGLPRWVVLSDADNELPIDLDNELMVDSAAHLLKGRKTATLYELLPAPEQLCATTPEGRFAHELIVMAARDRETRASAPVIVVDPATPRRFLPGSSWLYLKLYSGAATADALLRDYLAPAVRTARGMCDQWFFVRYGDPELHLRIRFAGEPGVLAGTLLPYLHRVLAPAVERGLVWKIAVDTYEREVERYGHIDLAEQLFCADSDCVLAILETCDGSAAADATWRLALRGIDRMMDDLGLSLDAKLATMTTARDGFGAEVGMDTAFQRRLGDKFRAHRAELADLLAAPDDAPEHPYGPALAMIAARSARLRPIGEQLRALGAPVGELVHSYVHMHVNRMIRSAQRAHELVLYDLLRRHYDGVVARTRKRTA